MIGKKEYTAAQKRAYNKKKNQGYSVPQRGHKVMRGKGSYYSEVKPYIKQYAKKALNVAGNTLGRYLGGDAGAQLGDQASNSVSKILGLGSYELKKNSLYGQQVPVMHSSQEEIRFRHREYLTDITGSSAFTLASYAVNPGLDTSFPFLSSIAQNFEQYEMHGICYYFKSTCGDALSSADNALGTVIMCGESNVNNPNFVSKQQMENSYLCSSGKPSLDQVCGIECAPAQLTTKTRLVRTGPVESGGTEQLYDLANFQIATQGMQGAYDIGELWVSYDITLKCPILNSGLGEIADSAHYVFNSFTSASPMSGATPKFDSIGMLISGTVISFPTNFSGLIMLAWYWTGSTATITYPSITLSSGISVLNILGSDANNVMKTAASSSTNLLPWVVLINVTSTGTAQTVTLGAGGTLPTGGTGDLIISQLNPGMTV